MENSQLKDNNNKSSFFNYLNKVKKHLSNIYLTKYLYIKTIVFLIVSILVLSTCFGMREAILNSKETSWVLIPGFLNIYITQNPGIAFSGLANQSSSIVYLVQSLPIIVGGIVFIFSSKIFLDISILFLFFGGLSNIVDRAIVDYYPNNSYLNSLETVNTVVDYFQFSESFISNFAIFNLPDVYVIFSVILLVISILINFVKEYRENKGNESNEPIKKTIIIEDKNYGKR